MKPDSMLARLMARLGGSPAASADEAVVVEATAALRAEFDAFKADAQAQHTELSSALETALEAVKDADAQVAQANARVAELQAALNAVADEQAKALEAAQAATLTARKEKIEATVGSEKVDALMTATTGLDDAAFDAVLSAMTLATDKEAKSKMFTEQGAAAEVDPGKVAELSAEMKLLQSRFPKNAD